jgi:hypothetical protein
MTVGDGQPTLGAGRKSLALFAAALTAWLVITSGALAPPLAELMLKPSPASPSFLFQQLPSALLLYAIFGAPIAIGASLVLGFPAFRFAQRRGLKKFSEAVLVGAGAGLAAFLGDVALTLLVGLPQGLDPNSSSSASDAHGEVFHNGLPTLYGWALKLIDLPIDMLAGAAAGGVAWRVSGIGRKAL